MVWVYIEVFTFYLYMLSSVVYIAYHQFVEGICFKKDQAQSDMRKTFTDFLTYANENLIWFAFNFILVFMPLICMFMLQPKTAGLDLLGQQSYTGLLVTVCAANLLQFILRPRLFSYRKRGAMVDGEGVDDDANEKDLIQDEAEHYVWME